MTLPNAADAPLLLTDDDVYRRVDQLVGPAIATRQLWIMFVDGDGRQAPVIMPISELPWTPEPHQLDNLAKILGGLRDELATDLGPGSVILTFERVGRDAVLSVDLTWADALQTVCEKAGMPLRGLFLSTDNGVRPLRR